MGWYKVFDAKFEIQDDDIKLCEKKPLDSYFLKFTKEFAIIKAIRDGYTATQIAKYLNLSKSAISKTYKQKVKLFEKLRDKGIFWSYSKNLNYEDAGEKLIIEYTLKYGDFDDIKLSLKLFGKRKLKKVWQESPKSDKSFIKTNLMIARVFFGMDVESD